MDCCIDNNKDNFFFIFTSFIQKMPEMSLNWTWAFQFPLPEKPPPASLRCLKSNDWASGVCAINQYKASTSISLISSVLSRSWSRRGRGDVRTNERVMAASAVARWVLFGLSFSTFYTCSSTFVSVQVRMLTAVVVMLWVSLAPGLDSTAEVDIDRGFVDWQIRLDFGPEYTNSSQVKKKRK